jgi:hypothetical protein
MGHEFVELLRVRNGKRQSRSGGLRDFPKPQRSARSVILSAPDETLPSHALVRNTLRESGRSGFRINFRQSEQS